MAGIGDEDCIVLLAHAAAARPDLAQAILEELDGIDDPRAGKAAIALRSKMGLENMS